MAAEGQATPGQGPEVGGEESTNQDWEVHARVLEAAAAGCEKADPLFELNPDLLCVLDAEGRFCKVNPIWKSLLGHSIADLAGKPFFDLIHPEDLQTTEAAAAQLQGQGAVFQCENRIRAHDGGYHWIEWRAYLEGNRIHAAGRDMSERRRAAAALAEDAIWRRILIDQSRDGVVVLDVDSHGVYKANQAFAGMLGYTLEEVHRLHIWDFDAQWTREQLVEMAANFSSSPSTFQTRHRRKDGSCYDAEVGFSSAEVDAERLLTFCVVRDVSDRNAAQTALRESEEKFSKAFQASPDAIYIVDKSGRTVDVNDGFERFTGYRREEVAGRLFRDLGLWIDPAARKEYIRLFETEGCVRRYQVRFRHRDGQEVWGELTADPIEIQGERCALCTARDVTERVRAEEERRRLEDRVQQAHKVESMGILAGGLAHDMNNVLGAILGLASAHLEPPPEDPSLRQALETRWSRLKSRPNEIMGVTTDVQRGDYARAPPLEIRASDQGGNVEIRYSDVTFGDMQIFEHWHLTGEPAMLIGMDALGLLDTLIIDYRRHELQIRLRDEP